MFIHSKRPLFGIAVCCFVYFIWFNHPFPLNDGTLSKQEAAEAALQYFALDSREVETSVTYGADKAIAAYLQKENLTSEYLEQFDPAYPLDYYIVEIAAANSVHIEALVHRVEGTIVGWTRRAGSAETAATPPDETSARATADQYVQSQRPEDLAGAVVSGGELEASTYAFHYVQNDERIGEAKRTAIVTVKGSEVIAYRSYFQPPDSFLHWLQEQDARASWLTSINFWMNAAMAAAALALAIVYRRYLSGTDGLVLLFIYVCIETLQHLNLYPNFVSMITLRSLGWPSLVFEFIYTFLFNTVFALTVYFPYIGAKALLLQQGRADLLHAAPGLTRRAELKAAVRRGYWFAGVILALQTIIFQSAGALFHIWWIPEPMLSTDNMMWPLLMPLSAWAAAIGEEIVYRLFAITALRKLLRSTVASVLLSSMLWGLGHTLYPIYPVYTRFVEVTIIGLVFGYLFIRFGFAAAVFAHAAIDSILMGLDVISRGDAPSIAMGMLYMAAPALIGWLLARWQPFNSNRSDLRPVVRSRLHPPDPYR